MLAKETQMNLTYILTGGWAAGYRTYIMTGIMVVTAAAAYATGDADLVTTIYAVAGALGFSTVRAAKS